MRLSPKTSKTKTDRMPDESDCDFFQKLKKLQTNMMPLGVHTATISASSEKYMTNWAYRC